MQIDWWTLGLQALNFAVLVWLLRRFLYAPVLRVIAERRAGAEAAMTRARAVQAEAEAAKASLEAQKKAFEEDRAALLAKAGAEAEAARKATLDQAKAEAEVILQKGRDALESERQAVMGEVGSDLAGLAAGLAGRILAETAPSIGPGVFLEGLAGRLEELPAEDREALAKAGGDVTVVTARPLDAAERKRWSARLKPLLGTDAALVFAEDPAILGGAELRLAQAGLRLGWADRLQSAKEAMSGDDRSS